MAAAGLKAQSDTTDPCYVDILERETASLPMPNGFVINAGFPVMSFLGHDDLNVNELEMKPGYSLEAFYYVDAYQFGFKHKQLGYCLTAGTRSIKRDIASAFYIEAGKTFTFKSKYDYWDMYNNKKKIEYSEETASFAGIGMKLSDFYLRNHDFVYFIDLSIDAISLSSKLKMATQLEIGSGYRPGIGSFALMPALSLGFAFLPPVGYYGDPTYKYRNVLLVSLNLNLGFSLNL
jgi:hypothetical protein